MGSEMCIRDSNRDDLTKIIHYAIIMLHLHDNYYKRDKTRKNDEEKTDCENF